MEEANAEEDVSVAEAQQIKLLNPVPRIGSKEADQDDPEIETDAESCMPGNVNDAGYARVRRPRREESESERGLHDEPRCNEERDGEHQCGDERRPRSEHQTSYCQVKSRVSNAHHIVKAPPDREFAAN